MHIFTAFLSGLIFAIGLGVSGMMSPQKVQGFLDLTGNWDPSLALVMGGALMVTMISYPLIMKRKYPLYQGDFCMPTNRKIDFRLIGGGVLFGAGWGIGGLCPGPALANLATLTLPVGVFVASMVAGWLIFQRLDALLKNKASKKESDSKANSSIATQLSSNSPA